MSLRIAEIAAGASLLTALLSLGTALFAAFYSRRTQERLQSLSADLDTRKSERNALRDYQYEARRRLYRECEPILFRLTEECESAFSRIATLARLSRAGRLGSGSGSWINEPQNQSSTLYRIAAPLAAFAILKERLTFFDLKLDSRIHFQYHLAQMMGEIFHHDLNIAKTGKELAYKPDSPIPEHEAASPAVFSRQGVSDEDFDAIISALTVDVQGMRRLLSYPSFNQMKRQNQEPVYDTVLRLDYLFRDFSPAGKPVLWRLLLAQAILCRALTVLHDRDAAFIPTSDVLRLSSEDREYLASADPDTGDKESEIDCVLAFLGDRLQRTKHLRIPKDFHG